MIDKNKGWILTNAHVARPSPAEIKVAFKDKLFVEGQKVYVDPFLDLAVISIDPKNIPKVATQAPLDCKTAPKIGTAVGAFGHPFGLEFTGTRGIISGETDDDIGRFLRTDASINPGNSGGPLISIDAGKVLGINSASVNDNHNQNTNFAIPMTYACKIIDKLQKNENPSPAKLGLSFFEPQFDLTELIVAKNFNGPQTVPLKTGDKILSIEGYKERIKNIGHLTDALRKNTKNVKIKIKRAGKTDTIVASFERAGLITKAKTVLVNGVVIGSTVYSDTAIFPFKLPFQIYSILPGSYADYIKMPYGGLISKIDGENIETFNLQRRDVSQVFAYKENFLAVQNLTLIEGQ